MIQLDDDSVKSKAMLPLVNRSLAPNSLRLLSPPLLSSGRASVFEEKTFIVDPISGCENAGQEYASRRQHKCNDQSERRHIWPISLPAAPPWARLQGLQVAFKTGHSLLGTLGIKRRPQQVHHELLKAIPLALEV